MQSLKLFRLCIGLYMYVCRLYSYVLFRLYNGFLISNEVRTNRNILQCGSNGAFCVITRTLTNIFTCLGNSYFHCMSAIVKYRNCPLKKIMGTVKRMLCWHLHAAKVSSLQRINRFSDMLTECVSSCKQ